MDEFLKIHKKTSLSPVVATSLGIAMIALSAFVWTRVIERQVVQDITEAASIHQQDFTFEQVVAARPKVSVVAAQLPVPDTAIEVIENTYHYSASFSPSEESVVTQPLVIPNEPDPAQLHAAASQQPEVVPDVPDVPQPLGPRTSAASLAASVAPSTDLKKWDVSYAYSLRIPKLDIEAPVLLPSDQYWNQHSWDLLEQQMQVGLSHGVVAYPHSVEPGRRGNLILAGHSSPPDAQAAKHGFGDLFATLPELEIGDTVEVMVDGELLLYEIEHKTVVEPSQTSILKQQQNKSTMKLITCYPVGTTDQRMVLTASLVE